MVKQTADVIQKFKAIVKDLRAEDKKRIENLENKCLVMERLIHPD